MGGSERGRQGGAQRENKGELEKEAGRGSGREGGRGESGVQAPVFKGDSNSHARCCHVLFPAAHLGALCRAAGRESSSVVRARGPRFPATLAVLRALAAGPFLRTEDTAFDQEIRSMRLLVTFPRGENWARWPLLLGPQRPACFPRLSGAEELSPACPARPTRTLCTHTLCTHTPHTHTVHTRTPHTAWGLSSLFYSLSQGFCACVCLSLLGIYQEFLAPYYAS